MPPRCANDAHWRSSASDRGALAGSRRCRRRSAHVMVPFRMVSEVRLRVLRRCMPLGASTELKVALRSIRMQRHPRRVGAVTIGSQIRECRVARSACQKRWRAGSSDGQPAQPRSPARHRAGLRGVPRAGGVEVDRRPPLVRRLRRDHPQRHGDAGGRGADRRPAHVIRPRADRQGLPRLRRPARRPATAERRAAAGDRDVPRRFGGPRRCARPQRAAAVHAHQPGRARASTRRWRPRTCGTSSWCRSARTGSSPS